MIDKQVFQELIAELENYYKREFTPFAQRAWYKHLNTHLSTEQFIEAVESAIVSKQFMPTPAEIVEMMCGTPENQAAIEWDLCIKAACRNDRTMLDGLSPQGQSALHLIGGFYKLGQTQEDKLEWVKKEFVSIWKGTPANTKSLPQSRTDDFKSTPDIVRDLAAKFSFNGNGDC